MNLHSIRQVAKTLKVDPGKLSKTQLIRKIQHAEGNFECYATAIDGECDQPDCAWRADCLNSAADASASVH